MIEWIGEGIALLVLIAAILWWLLRKCRAWLTLKRKQPFDFGLQRGALVEYAGGVWAVSDVRRTRDKVGWRDYFLKSHGLDDEARLRRWIRIEQMDDDLRTTLWWEVERHGLLPELNDLIYDMRQYSLQRRVRITYIRLLRRQVVECRVYANPAGFLLAFERHNKGEWSMARGGVIMGSSLKVT